MAEKSMQEAVDEVRTLPDYSSKGEVTFLLCVHVVVMLYARTYVVGDDCCTILHLTHTILLLLVFLEGNFWCLSFCIDL